ncbi:excalibur calcium-binding domain-containing protein [Micromonospora matsumotoense]|uniref:excalibur calcium-binding domain-containing protein n=1 Tax=Micromonospora matsumotoense TaxID=121616 RepID=UPI003428C9DA
MYYANCTTARAAGAAPIRRGDPGYPRKLDRDGGRVRHLLSLSCRSVAVLQPDGRMFESELSCTSRSGSWHLQIRMVYI